VAWPPLARPMYGSAADAGSDSLAGVDFPIMAGWSHGSTTGDPSLMDAQLLLADSAQVAADNGKVYALGLGWTATTTPLPPQAVIILVDVDWDETNQPHDAVISLVDADGYPVLVSTPIGEQELKVEARFESGRPAGWPPGAPLRVPLSFAVGQGLPLAPGRYTWRLAIDGQHQSGWEASFLVSSRPGRDDQPGMA
jgi:hypothetical protein